MTPLGESPYNSGTGGRRTLAGGSLRRPEVNTEVTSKSGSHATDGHWLLHLTVDNGVASDFRDSRRHVSRGRCTHGGIRVVAGSPAGRCRLC